MTAGGYNSEGLEGAVFSRKKICASVEVVLSFRVTWDAAVVYESPIGQSLIHDSRSFQYPVWLEIPGIHISRGSQIKESLDRRITHVGVVAGPAPHANDAVEKIKVSWEVVPE